MVEGEKPDVRRWGYSKEEPGGRIFDNGVLPPGYYPNPAMVPGSEAEKRYREDAARDGAAVPWDAAPADANAQAASVGTDQGGDANKAADAKGKGK